MAEIPPHGVRVVSDDGVQCHVCGRTYKYLGIHVVKAHGYTTAKQYRREFGLSYRGLVNDETRALIRERTRAHLAEISQPELLVPGWKDAGHSAEFEAKRAANLDRAAAAAALSVSNTRRKQATHCRRGHPYDATNTRIAKDGSRACRVCGREDSRAHRARGRR